jgi:hypothetical protein
LNNQTHKTLGPRKAIIIKSGKNKQTIEKENDCQNWHQALFLKVIFEWIVCLIKGMFWSSDIFCASSNCVDLNEKLGYYGRISYFIPPSFFFNIFYIHFNFTVIFTFIPFDVYFPYISLFKGHLVIWCNSSHTIDFIVHATLSASI